MARLFGVWYGGTGTREPAIPRDVEVFHSLTVARLAFQLRGYGQATHFRWTQREPEFIEPLRVHRSTSTLRLWLTFPSRENPSSRIPAPTYTLTLDEQGRPRVRAKGQRG